MALAYGLGVIFILIPLVKHIPHYQWIIIGVLSASALGFGILNNVMVEVSYNRRIKKANMKNVKVPSIKYMRIGGSLWMNSLIDKKDIDDFLIGFTIEDPTIATKKYALGSYKIVALRHGETKVIFKEYRNKTTKSMTLVVH